MKIDLDHYYGPTATRHVEELEAISQDGIAYIECWRFSGQFPGFSFLKHCGPLAAIHVSWNPRQELQLDFSSVPLPLSVTKISINSGNISPHKAQACKKGVTINGLDHIVNLKHLTFQYLSALNFGGAFPKSIEQCVVWSPGKIDTESIVELPAGNIDLIGFERRYVKNYNFISRFTHVETLNFSYFNGIEVLPPFHALAKLKILGLYRARLLQNIEALASATELEDFACIECPNLTTEAFKCLQGLRKLKRFYVGNKKQAAELRPLFPNTEFIVESLRP